MAAVLSRLCSLLLLAALAGAAWAYPLNHLALGLALAAYGALLWWRPESWLLLVPALLPVLDLAPWNGWFYLDALDLMLLATAAVGYWRLAPGGARLPVFFRLLFGLAAASFALSAVIGVLPLAPLDANAFASYSSHYNSLRVFKGYAWAIVLLPLLRRSAGPELVNLQRYFVPGMLLGLAFTCLAVMWERSVFPGLLNFSSDYRPTAPFAAMHTGGAALDAYLALSFPFVASWLIGARPRWQLGLAMLLLLMGSYAGLTIFSRDIYLAYGCSGAILLALVFARRARHGRFNGGALLGAALALAIVAYALIRVFGSGGYRALAAALMLLAAAVLLAGAAQRLARIGLFAAATPALLLAVGALAALHDKGAYLGFALAAAVFALAALFLFFGDRARAGAAMAFGCAAFPAMALALLLIGWHWGGGAALADAAVLAGLAAALLAVNRLLPQPVLTLDRSSLTLTVVSAIVFATLIPVTSSYYLGSRFATVGDDFALRLRHWSEAIDMMEPDFATGLAGMGLGRYPDVYAWKNTHGEQPGSFSFERERDGNQFLRLGAPQYAIGYGEVLRVLQRVDLSAAQSYRLAAEVRRPTEKAEVAFALCERWLLYPQNCVAAPIRLAGPVGAWGHYEVALDATALAGQAGTRGAPVQLEIANTGGSASIDVDKLSLRAGGSGPELLRNGGFEDGNDYWFFSSDRNHLPYHVKNFAVNTYFEQGWLGVASITLLLLYVAGELALRGLHGETPAAIALAALAGFLVVGMFDSLFDVPRLTLVFLLVLCGAMLRPASKPSRRRRRKHGEQASAARLDPVPAQQVVHGGAADAE